MWRSIFTAHRFRRKLNSRTFLAGQGLSVKVTASVGCATYPFDGRTAEELLKAADKAMYKAKELGRDEVVQTADLAETAANARSPAASSCRDQAIQSG